MTDLQHWRIAVEDGLGVLTLDKKDSAQNVLSSEVMSELNLALDQLDTGSIRGLVIESAKGGGFIAGADVSEFETVDSPAEAKTLVTAAHNVLNRLESMGVPSVAKINGHCLGGGLELALACTYRVVCDDPSVRLGLPEVMLGIHPGFGGTVRLTETIGVPAAMDLMLSGRTVIPKIAKRMGIVDLAVPERQLSRAVDFVLNKKSAKRSAGGWKKALNVGPVRIAMAKFLQRQVAAKADPNHYPAPYQIIELWQKHGGDRKAMLEAEIESVCKLVATPTSRNLVKVFFLQEELKKLGKADGAEKREFERVHVIGAGVMGGDIASWCALRGMTVTIHDRSAEALARARKRAHQLFTRKLRDKRLVQRAMDRFQPDLKNAGAQRADVIIEAIFENAEAKISVFSEMQKVAKPDAILATNTSSIPLETLCNALSKPGRLVGLHFFNPVAKMQLVEIVKGEKTYAKVAKAASQFAGQISRLPVPVKSSPGFLVNRILMPYLLEAVELYKEGVPGPAIDKVATRFGMPMGPITLADTVGLDICLHVAENLTQSYGGEVPKLLEDKVSAGKLGKKSGEGFYTWGKKGADNSGKGGSGSVPNDTEDRMIFRYLNETVACLHEGIVDNARHIDGGLIFGTGFAPFRGGPISYIVEKGQATMLERLETLHEKYGDRFKPSDGWKSLDLADLLQSK
ncbi:MAG: 3-hydroxyacyl-CoA dehydrogenase NAD-binding domain-containing protein [Pseudomonadota bacterium]